MLVRFIFAFYAFVVITLPDSPIASRREKFSLSVATTIVSYCCGRLKLSRFVPVVLATQKRQPNV